MERGEGKGDMAEAVELLQQHSCWNGNCDQSWGSDSSNCHSLSSFFCDNLS